MSRKIRSIRGEIVDFDLFAIKQQILTTPKNEDVKKRERFIDKKRRRGTRNTVSDVVAQQSQNEAAVREALAKQKAEKASAVVPVSDAVDTTPTNTETTSVKQKIVKR